MGEDKKPRQLLETTNISNQLNFSLLCDKNGLSEAFEINLNELLNQKSSVSSSNNTDLDDIYDCITPKIFLGSKASEDEYGITAKASKQNITNRTAAKALCVNNLRDAMSNFTKNINNSNLSTYRQYESCGLLSSININYCNKYNKNINMNGQITVNFGETSNVYAIYLKNLNLPKGSFSAGSALAIVGSGNNIQKCICKTNIIDGWLLELAFHPSDTFLKNNNYFIDFSINYNI